jgi:hypothetical protein
MAKEKPNPRPAKRPPFEFVLEALERASPYTKPLFGCTAVYVGEQIVFALREKAGGTEDNGVWIATFREHHESLRKELPPMRSLAMFGGDTDWQVLPSSAPDFEECALRACALVLRRDPRIGKVPKTRRPKTKAPKARRK